MQFLLKHRAIVDNLNADEETALRGASKNGHEAVVQILLQKGAKINLRSGALQEIALEAAALNSHKDVMQVFLENGALTHANSDEMTPLHFAARSGHEECCSTNS